MAVTIRHGVNTLSLDSIAGKCVADVRDQVADILNVPESAQVRVNGTPACNEAIIPESSTVEFVKVAGEKGSQ